MLPMNGIYTSLAACKAFDVLQIIVSCARGARCGGLEAGVGPIQHLANGLTSGRPCPRCSHLKVALVDNTTIISAQ